MYKSIGTVFLILAVIVINLIFNTTYAASKPPISSNNVLDVINQCDNKYPGQDQVSQLAVTVENKSGNRRHTIYQRIWKNLQSESNNQLDKMTLFAMSPPDVKNTAFMRYTFSAGKNADQWIYLPQLRKMKRVSIRDLGDSFLGSDLTYGDIAWRFANEDQHTLLQVKVGENGDEVITVESRPKEMDSIYSKKISEFVIDATSQTCLKRHIAYFDRKGALLKQQSIDWQQVDDAWLWRRVEVQNAQTFSKSVFEVSKVKVNVGVTDKWFTERMLKRGLN